EHVRTQMPYALVACGVALIFGHGAAAVGMPALLSWPLGLLALGAAVRLLGARIEPAPTFVPAPSEPATSDRKSTRLNSSHVKISYAVFCLKKKKKDTIQPHCRPA